MIAAAAGAKNYLIKGSHSFGLVIPDCELYWTHVQISSQAIEKASMY